MRRLLLGCLALFAVCLSSASALAEEAYARNSIDLGLVVADADASAKFYTEALGMKELPSFSAPGDFTKDIGLTSGEALNVRVLAIDDKPEAAKLKLMAIPGVETKKADNKYLHSEFGFRYITLIVTDMDASVERLKKAGVKFEGNTPAALPKSLGEGVFIAVVRDPDGNFVELVGPKKK